MSLRNAILATLLLLPLVAGAQETSGVSTDPLKVSAPGDHTDMMPTLRGSRLITFRYSPDVSFAIRALVDTFVNVEVPQGEVIQGLYLSDATDWSYHVAGDNRRVFIKPMAPGKINTGTLITDKRSYELTLISVPLGQMWFQRVQWRVPGQGDDPQDGLYWRGQTPQAQAGGVNAADLDPNALHFGYAVRGRADFAPTTVFDDGTRTWFRFDAVQDLPAIFAKLGAGLEVVDYTRSGPYIVVPQLADSFVLRLRNAEITVERKR